MPVISCGIMSGSGTHPHCQSSQQADANEISFEKRKQPAHELVMKAPVVIPATLLSCHCEMLQ